MKNNTRLFLISIFLVITLSVLACISTTPTAVQPPTNIATAQGKANTDTAVPATAFTGLSTPTALPIAIETSVQQPSSTATLKPTAISNGPLQVHFIDVGQGDAILILAPDGQTMLIDGGDTDTGVVQYLKSKGIQHLNFVVATHPHSDHIGGLVQVLKAIPVDKVVTNGQAHTTSTYEHFLDAIATAKAVYAEVKRGDTITLGSLKFDVLSPVSITGDMNNNSVVLRLVFGKVTFLFMGDAQADAEASMLAAGLIQKTDILKVGHHGSRSSSSPAFLSAVKPAVAIYSAGLGNDYGHPHRETIQALQAIGAAIYGTDVNGSIIVTSDGSGYSIETAKQGQAQAPPVVQPTASSGLSIEVVSLTSPIAPGGRASLTIKTTPGAACTITVYYKSGPSQAQGLGPQTADSNGSVTWSWKVGSKTTPGTWRIVVTASINGQTISQEIPFVVQ